jgi:hypothetical protein
MQRESDVSEEHAIFIVRVKEISLLPASADSLLGLHFNSEFGGDMFLRNVRHHQNYMVLQPR